MALQPSLVEGFPGGNESPIEQQCGYRVGIGTDPEIGGMCQSQESDITYLTITLRLSATIR